MCYQESEWTAALDETITLSYPPQADGLHPLHGAHVKDIYPVLAVHRDMGGTATWRRRSRASECRVPPFPALRPQWHGQGPGAQRCLWWGSHASHLSNCVRGHPTASTTGAFSTPQQDVDADLESQETKAQHLLSQAGTAGPTLPGKNLIFFLLVRI